MSRFGPHIVSGSRNGYGEFCAARPAVVLAVDEGGALLEAKQKSGGHTVTIFRQTSVYLEAPPDFNTHPDMVALARYWYPQLKAKWQQNPADYYTITNEIGGNDEAVLARLVAFEREMMRLANLDGFKLCVLNLAGGSPGDIEIWKRVCLPFVVEAWAGRNIYGRHAYGEGDLINPDGSVIIGNPSRPFEELGYLRQAGAAGGIAITECGLDGGYGFAGVERFTRQLQGYEKLLRPYPEFIGCCAWTLGNWSEANWQDALPTMTQYLIDNPSPAWTWPEPTPPPAEFSADVWPVPSLRINQWFAANPQNYQQYGLPGHDGTDHRAPTGTPVWSIAAGTVYAVYEGENYGIQVRIDHNGHKSVYAHLQAAHIEVGQPVAAGDNIGAADNTGNSYGSHLHLAYKRDGQTYTDPAGNVWPSNLFDPWLCLSPLLEDYLNTAGLTGWAWAASTLKHPHFPAVPWGYGNNVNLNLRRTPDSSQPPIGVIPAGVPFKITGAIQGGYYPVRALLSDAPPAGVDMARYFLPAGSNYGPVHLQSNNWGGGDERIQLQKGTAADGAVYSYQTKNSQWEKRLIGGDYIDLKLDTSPGGGEYYAVSGHWLPRFMNVGDVFSRTETVTFRRKSDCQPVPNKPPFTWTTQIKLEVIHPTWTTEGGLTFNDVAVLAWIQDGFVRERYVVAPSHGLITWQEDTGRRSWASQLLTGAPNNQRETGCYS